MQVEPIQSDSSYNNSAIPEGKVLVFYAIDNQGQVVKRYKDSSGNFGNL